MDSKKWTVAFVSLIALVLAGIMALNFIVDPYGYFRCQGGDYYEMDDDDYLRELKAEHIKKLGGRYDAFLIGGSKGGAIRTEKLKELDGYNYYNCWVLAGNFPDYLAYTKFVLEHTDARKILLQISTTELYEFDHAEYGDIYEVPAVMSGESKVAEYARYLMKNPKVAWEELRERMAEDYVKYPCLPTGERNLGKYYDYYGEHASADSNEYFNYIMKGTAKYFKYMDRDVPEKPESVEQCMEYLREIKKRCDKKGVELQVFFGSLYAPQMMRNEGKSFYDLLERTVMVCGDVWCFNDFSEITLCPYNYYNVTHYFYEVGDLMVDTMAGKDTGHGDFGVLLTRDNVSVEIAKRRQKLAEWKAYYMKNGTLPYMGYDSAANLHNANNNAK